MDRVKPRKIRGKKSTISFDIKEDVVNEFKAKKERKRKILEVEPKKDLSKVKIKRLKGHKIRYHFIFDEIKNVDDVFENEKVLDEECEIIDHLSFGLIALILFVCLILGVGLGYILYRIAINSSAFIVGYSFL